MCRNFFAVTFLLLGAATVILEAADPTNGGQFKNVVSCDATCPLPALKTPKSPKGKKGKGGSGEHESLLSGHASSSSAPGSPKQTCADCCNGASYLQGGECKNPGRKGTPDKCYCKVYATKKQAQDAAKAAKKAPQSSRSRSTSPKKSGPK